MRTPAETALHMLTCYATQASDIVREYQWKHDKGDEAHEYWKEVGREIGNILRAAEGSNTTTTSDQFQEHERTSR